MGKSKFRAAVASAIVRLYTLAILGVVLMCGYTAVTYLFRSVFQPADAPATLLDWQGTVDAEALRTGEARGITAPAIRSPIAHYHGVDRWFHPDLRNGCITSGCHDPIPHRQSKELRAFANLHATFLSCETCHQAPAASPMSAVWVDLRSGEAQPAPVILQLMNRLAVATQPADLADQSAAIIASLRQALDVIGGDPVLEYLALRLETAEPGSPVWRHAMEQLRAELPNHARGEYGAKIAPARADGTPDRRDFGDLIERYFSRDSGQTDRGAIHKDIHAGVIEKPQACAPCHRAEPALLDFTKLGYSPERIRQLTSTPIVGMMQQIREGQPFSLPLGP